MRQFHWCLLVSLVSLQMRNPMMLTVKDSTVKVSTLIQGVRWLRPSVSTLGCVA